jgi:hypothetical protein
VSPPPDQEFVMQVHEHITPVTSDTTRAPVTWKRSAARWLVTFLGFPVGGYAAYLTFGRVDGLSAALLGGALTGAVLGAIQSWGIGRHGPPARDWIIATAVGLMIGLAVGAAAVDYRTDIGALAVQGAITGLAVGAAQAVLLRTRLGRLAWAWPPALGALWAAGWVVTTWYGVDVDKQFMIFGASGALVVTAATTVLPVLLDNRGPSSSSPAATSGS